MGRHPGGSVRPTARDRNLPVRFVQHDRDKKFSKAFAAALRRLRVKNIPGACRAPNTNAFVERCIQSIGQECLDHFVVLDERHLNYLVREFLEHYHLERPHQSLENKTVMKSGYRRKTTDEASTLPLGDVACTTWLGLLLKHNYRKAG